MFDKSQLNQLYRYCVVLTNDQDAAYDLLQGALEKYLKNRKTDDDISMALIRTIIRNLAIDQWRHQQKVANEPLDDVESTTAIDALALDQLVMNEKILNQIWQSMTLEERELMYLWAVEGFTAQEIATALSLPRGTILSRIFRLKKKLNQFDQDASFNVAGGA